MKRSTSRLILLLTAMPMSVVVFGIGYMLAMDYLEGSPRNFWSSLEWASETLTTTGYGADSHWNNPILVLYVILVQFTGMFLVWLLFPIYLIPFFEERFEAWLPVTLPGPSKMGYVLIFRYGPAVPTLIEELRRYRLPVVVLEEDRELARRLQEQDLEVVHMRQPLNAFSFKGINHASAVIANGSDHDNAALLLIVRDNGFTGSVYALIENPLHRQPLITWGAAAVYTPAHILAAALASKASRRISPAIQGVQQLGERLGVAELRIHTASPLAGLTIAQADLRNGLGIVVLGYWHNGQFVPRPLANTPLTPGNIVVVVGHREAVKRLSALAVPLRRSGTIIIVGLGEVGQKVREMLNDAGEKTVTIDKIPAADVDIIGNALDQAILEQAGVQTARAVILALSDDSESLFAATIIREFAPDVPLIARVIQPQTVSRLYRVGADFALSTSQVAGQLLAQHLLGEAYIGVEHDLKLVKVQAYGLTGKHPFRARVLETTGCQVVAIERDGEIIVQFDAQFLVTEQDTIFLAGAPAAIDVYNALFKVKRPVVSG